jgi:tetraacyldisaccharide 4'-kinase
MVENALQKAWQKRGWLACLLWPAAQVYGLVISVRKLLFRHRLLASGWTGVPTIVVGNVIAGGAGKTPLVMLLVDHLQSRNYRVGVVSRGFGRTGVGCQEVRPETTADESGDEPALVKRISGVPVFVALRRLDAAAALLKAYPETQVLICDDGLQHYALQRDIEIAVFDDRGVGNGWLLPAGPLREPWPKRFNEKVDLVLHTGEAPVFEGFTSSRRLADYALAADGSATPLLSLIGKPLVAFAGIANPQAFFRMLRSRGLTLVKTFALPDHYDFKDFHRQLCAGTTVLCTEKDAVKLFQAPEFKQIGLLAVPLVVAVSPDFLAALDSLVTPLVSELPFRHGHKTA